MEMVVKKLLVDDKLIRAQANMSPRCSYVMFPIEKQSGKTFYFLEKSVLLIFKFCPLSKLMFCFFFMSC